MTTITEDEIKIKFYNENEKLSNKKKFILMFDLLTSNMNQENLLNIIFLSVYYLQILCAFYSKHLNIFDENDTSDNILITLNKLLRIRDNIQKKTTFEYTIYFLLCFILFLIIIGYFCFKKTKRKNLYSNCYILFNLLLKIFFYYVLGIVIEIFSSILCFSKSKVFIEDYNCSLKGHIFPFIIILIAFIISFFGTFFLINNFYIDSFLLNDNFFSQIICNYWILMLLNNIQISITLRFIEKIKKEIFLILNIIISIYLFIFYYKNIIFYNEISNTILGIFHMLYIWTTLFCFVFNYINIYERGLLYILSSIILCFIFINLKNKYIKNLLCDIPFYKIKDKAYILFYIKKIISLVSGKNKSLKNQKILNGVIRLHMIECPNKECLTKKKDKLYLPLLNEWTDRKKPFINDQIFLYNYVLSVFIYFINTNCKSIELYINLCTYYLNTIGNLNLTILYYLKLKKMKKNLSEMFLYNRLKILISNKLIEKLKNKNEYCENLEDLNTSYLFLYEKYREYFINEIFKDLNLNIEFWKSFLKKLNKSGIDFNQIFKKTAEIRIAKNNISFYWKKLFSIYNGINELFDFYMDYTEIINDDSYLKRELEEIKRKSENFTENLEMNFYNLLFRNDTGICLISGDVEKEGIIYEVNNEFCEIFLYNKKEILFKNIKILMPKFFSLEHDKMIKNYINLSEKKIINTKPIYTYAIDKENSLLYIKLEVKIFPILNDSLLFIGLINNEKVDDLIFVDNNFIIQGISKKLRENLNINNANLFIENDIPFYMICKNFVNFYKTFMKSKNELKNNYMESDNDIESDSEVNNYEDVENEILNKNSVVNNIEINENIELEYEIKIPEFILEFSKIEKNLLNSKITIDETEIINNLKLKETVITQTIEEEDNKSKNQEEEYESLIQPKKNSQNLKNDPRLMTFKKETTIKIDIPSDNKSPNFNSNQTPFQTPNNSTPFETKKKNDWENIFYLKLKEYKILFNKNKFEQLEKLIDEDNQHNTHSYRFNFTFKKYEFREKIGFTIKCINNKTDLNDFDDSEEYEDGMTKVPIKIGLKKEDLKKCYSVNNDEFDIINENNTKYFYFLNNDEDFENLDIKYKEETKKYSRILGNIKKEEYEDENLSQSAQTGFKNDLSKINKILEIREKVMNNNSRFWTLKYIIIFLIIWVILCIAFIIIYEYLIIFLDNNLRDIDTLHGSYYLSFIRTTEMISSLISIRTYERFILYMYTINVNIFIENVEDYFSYLVNQSINWNDKSILLYGEMQGNFSKFLDNIQNLVYNQTELKLLNSLDIIVPEPYIFSLVRGATNSKSILKSEILTPDFVSIFNIYNNKDVFYDVEYLFYSVIENSYDKNIPLTLNFLNLLRIKLIKYNNHNVIYLYLIIFIYYFITMLLIIFYLQMLFLTNNYMGKGLEKLSVISQDKIEEVIQKIEDFKESYKYLKKNNVYLQSNYQIKKYVKENEKKKNNNLRQTINATSIKNPNEKTGKDEKADIFGKGTSDFSSFETKKNKKLSLHNSNYFHLILVALSNIIIFIFLFILTRTLLIRNKEVLELQAYLLGKILLAVSSTIYIKCLMSQCDIHSKLDYQSFFDNDLVYSLYKSLNNFPEFSNYYKNYFLLDACASMYEKNTKEYEICIENDIVKSVNNTEGFLSLLIETVQNIEFEYNQNIEKNENYNSFYLYESFNFFLMEIILYNYIDPIIVKIDDVIGLSFHNMISKQKKKLNSIIILFVFIIVIFIAYIFYFFIPKLENLLDVSNSILKIIPTNIISSSQDMENWFEQLNSDK